MVPLLVKVAAGGWAESSVDALPEPSVASPEPPVVEPGSGMPVTTNAWPAWMTSGTTPIWVAPVIRLIGRHYPFNNVGAELKLRSSWRGELKMVVEFGIDAADLLRNRI